MLPSESVDVCSSMRLFVTIAPKQSKFPPVSRRNCVRLAINSKSKISPAIPQKNNISITSVYRWVIIAATTDEHRKSSMNFMITPRSRRLFTAL